MSQIPKTDTDMIAYWNGETGLRWVEDQVQIDAMLAPFGLALLKAADPRPGDHALDIGCGCGDTTIALAGAVAPGGVATGVDVSAPMLTRARARVRQHERAVPARFIEGDAGSLPMPAGEFDLMISRFGVMFFEDPVRAFQNLHRGLKPGGRLAFVCWRRLDENPWMFAPLAAVSRHVPPGPRPGPEDPGPFSFGDPVRVRRILESAGFKNVALAKFDAMLAAGRTLDEAVNLVATRGPVAAALDGASPAQRAAALEAVRDALKPHATADGVLLGGAAWVVTARA